MSRKNSRWEPSKLIPHVLIDREHAGRGRGHIQVLGIERRHHSTIPLPHLESGRIPQRPKRSIARRLLLAAGALLAVLGSCPDRAAAVRGVLNYPKTLTYSSEINLLSEAERESLAWHDIVVLMGRREHYNTLRRLREEQAGNRELRFLYQLMPQLIPYWDGQPATWIPDTLRSPYRKMMFYARMNDWYLYDTSGNRINVGNDVMLNWTPHCPPGTFGDSKGLRVAEWYARTLAQIAVEGRGWEEPWRWDEFDGGTPNGLIFEVYLDCWGSLNPMPAADPDRDGVAEGVTRSCTGGGYQEPLTLLIAEESEVFWQTIRQLFPADFVICLQSNNQYDGPSWRNRMNGMKFENWMRVGYGRQRTWFDTFYGGLKPGGDSWDVGYAWAESNLQGGHESLPDDRKGWDLTFIETWQDGSPAEYQRQKRWGLGTILLGDGYFCHTKDQVRPQWEPEFDWDFGNPLESFWTNVVSPTDTVYVRRFSNGMVEVNPNPTPRLGIPARDSRFTFWMPVDDLSATPVGQGSIRVRWSIPDGEHNDADYYELRYSRVPITLESWDSASDYEGNPLDGVPGQAMEATIRNLAPGADFYFALRGTTEGYVEPVLSNVAHAATPPAGPGDESPPGSIEDVAATHVEQNWIQLAWTAPGDDGDEGTATVYHLRYLPGEAIRNDSDWNAATVASGLPSPRPAGSWETYALHGLSPDRAYGVCIRAEDDAGLLGDLSQPYIVETLPASADTIAPGAVTDLAGRSGTIGEILLAWTAPGDDGGIGRADRYEIRYLLGAEIAGEEDWARALGAPDPPEPSNAGAAEVWSLRGLLPGTLYGVAIRAWDEAGGRAALSNSVLAASGVLEDSTGGDEDSTPPGAVRSLTGIALDHDTALLTWTSPGDDGDEGTADRYELRVLVNERIEDEQDWSRATVPAGLVLPEPLPAGSYQSVTIEGLEPLAWYGALVRAFDSHGNRSPMTAGVYFRTLAAPPPPDTTPPDPVADLHAVAADTSWIRLEWTAPTNPGEAMPPARYEMRMAIGTSPDDRIWSEGVAVPGLPAPARPGESQAVGVLGLVPAMEYAFLLRSCDGSGNWSEDSNTLRANTSEVPDPPPPPLPPCAIRDVQVPETDLTSATVFWTAPGDDGDDGRATKYLARIQAGAPILTQEDWDRAETPDTTGIPRPSAAGSAERWTLSGLAEDALYGLCVRAVDDSGLIGGISNPTVFRTASPPPPPVPDAVLDLACAERGPTWFVFTWSSPTCGGDREPAAGYAIGVRPGAAVFRAEADWQTAMVIESGLPEPSDPGEQETARLDSFLPDSAYSFVLRARSSTGLLGPLGNTVQLRTQALPDTGDVVTDPPPAAIRDLVAEDRGARFIRLGWTAVGEDSLDGQAGAYDLRILKGAPISTAGDWAAALPVTEGVPPPARSGTRQACLLTGLDASTSYGICLRAIDKAQNPSPLAGAIVASTSDSIPPPGDPPAPVTDLAAVPVGADSVEISWTATGASADPDGPIRYLLAIAKTPPTLDTWADGVVDSVEAGTSIAGDTLTSRSGGLDAGTSYYASVRARGRSGILSSLSNTAVFATQGLDLAPPQPPTGVTLQGMGSAGRVVVAWTASPDPDVTGYRVYGRSGDNPEWTLLTPDPVPTTESSVQVPAGYAFYAASALDRAGNESALSRPAAALAEDVTLEGPFPHPVGDRCRFLLSVSAELARERAALRLLNVLGHEVKVIFDGSLSPGVTEVRWDRTDASGSRVAPGFYTIRFEVAERKLQRRIFLEP